MAFINIIRNWNTKLFKQKNFFASLSLLILLLIIMTLLLIFVDTIGGLNWFSIYMVRIPKMPPIIIMGAGTAMSGLLLQKVTRNRLADTGLLGISHSGIFLMTIITIWFPWFNSSNNNPLLFTVAIPFVIALAALLTMLAMYVLSIKGGVAPKRIILMGIGITMFFSAATTLVTYLTNGYDMHFLNRYLVGWIEVKPALLWITSLTIIFIAMIFVIIIGKKIDILESSESIAKSVGIRVELIKISIFFIVAIVIGFTTSVVGSVSLLGLLAPSIARTIFKNTTRELLIGSVIIGIIFVMFAQFININLMHIAAPIGIIIQLTIAPYFLYRVFTKKGDI